MSSGYSTRRWECPFFRWDERRCIHCEGGRMHMQDLESYRRYVRTYCDNSGGWENCTMARSLMDYYDAMGGRPERELL